VLYGPSRIFFLGLGTQKSFCFCPFLLSFHSLRPTRDQHRNTMRHTAAHCHALHNAVTHCNTLHDTATPKVHLRSLGSNGNLRLLQRLDPHPAHAVNIRSNTALFQELWWCHQCSGVLQCVAVCCSVLQCGAISVVVCEMMVLPSACPQLPRSVAVRCSDGAAICLSSVPHLQKCCRVLQCAAVRHSAPQCGAVCCSVLQCGAVCCSVLHCVSVCSIPNYPEE